MVPNGWLNTSIDDNISFSGGAQPPREVFKFEPEEGYIRLIQIRDYKTDKFVTYVPEKLAKKFCTVDDVMIGRYGPPIFQILRGIEGAYNVALIKAIPKDGVDREFMYYFLKRDPLLRVIESYSQRTSGQTGIEMDVLKAYPMHLPPLPEQHKIAKILSTWDKAISTTEKLIETSKQQKKALMQQLLTGKKRMVNPETGEVFQEGVEHQCLSKLTYQITNGFVGTATPYYTDETGVPYLYGLNVKNNKLNSKGLRYVTEEFHAKQVKSQLVEGDLLMVQSGHIGETAVVTKDYENSNCHALIVIKPLREKVFPNYLSYYFNSEYGKYRLKCLEVGSTIMHINTKDMKKFAIPLPSLAEQQKIASVLTAADKEIEVLEAKLAYFKQEKKALMQQLLTGKRRVKVDEVA